jgi:hypothetical protein
MLRGISGPKSGGDGTGGWRKYEGDQFKEVMGRAFNTHGKMQSAYKILVGRTEAKRQLGRKERRWKGCIEMGLKRIGC